MCNRPREEREEIGGRRFKAFFVKKDKGCWWTKKRGHSSKKREFLVSLEGEKEGTAAAQGGKKGERQGGGSDALQQVGGEGPFKINYHYEERKKKRSKWGGKSARPFKRGRKRKGSSPPFCARGRGEKKG